MSYRIVVVPKARRDIQGLPLAVQKRVNTAVKALRENPRPPGVKKLQASSDLYRIRVGDYRVIYAIRDDVLIVIVVTVGHRKDAYERLLSKYTPERIQSITREKT